MTALAQVQSHLLSASYSVCGQTVKEAVELANQLLRRNFASSKVSQLGYVVEVASLHIVKHETQDGPPSYKLSLRLQPVKLKSDDALLDESCRHPRLVLGQSLLTADAAADILNAELKREINGGAHISQVRIRADALSGESCKRVFSVIAATSPIADMRARALAANHMVMATSVAHDISGLSSRLNHEGPEFESRSKALHSLDIIIERGCSFSPRIDNCFYHAAAAYAPYAGTSNGTCKKEHYAIASDPHSLANACQSALRNAHGQANGSPFAIRWVQALVLYNPGNWFCSPVYVAIVAWKSRVKRQRATTNYDEIVVAEGIGFASAANDLQRQLHATSARALKLRGVALITRESNAHPQHQGYCTAIVWGTRSKKGAVDGAVAIRASASRSSFEETRLSIIGQIANITISPNSQDGDQQESNHRPGNFSPRNFSYVELLLTDASRTAPQEDQPPPVFVSMAVSPPFEE